MTSTLTSRLVIDDQGIDFHATVPAADIGTWEDSDYDDFMGALDVIVRLAGPRAPRRAMTIAVEDVEDQPSPDVAAVKAPDVGDPLLATVLMVLRVQPDGEIHDEHGNAVRSLADRSGIEQGVLRELLAKGEGDGLVALETMEGRPTRLTYISLTEQGRRATAA